MRQPLGEPTEGSRVCFDHFVADEVGPLLGAGQAWRREHSVTQRLELGGVDRDAHALEGLGRGEERVEGLDDVLKTLGRDAIQEEVLAPLWQSVSEWARCGVVR